MPLYYVIRKDIPSPEEIENRDVKIIYQESIVGNMLTRKPRQIMDIIKELAFGTDAETCIKGLKCGRNTMQ